MSESEIEERPESFSPNVLLRPLYQEMILPNIAYVGGGAEIAYWMQLKTAFDQESIPFPILILRNSCLWLEQNQLKKWQNLEFKFSDFFIDEHQLQKQYVNKKTDLDLSDEMNALKKVFADILFKALDTGMQSSILAEQKQIDAFDKLEKKLLKNEKKNHQQSLLQISQLKTKLFPNNGLQERHDNFIPFYLKHGENFIEILLKELKPLDVKFCNFESRIRYLMQHEKILILDFGSQYTQLIARRVRELNIYCEIHPFNNIPKLSPNLKGVILSGSPFSVREENAPIPDLKGIKGRLPLLGVCYGAQYLAHKFEVRYYPQKFVSMDVLTFLL